MFGFGLIESVLVIALLLGSAYLLGRGIRKMRRRSRIRSAQREVATAFLRGLGGHPTEPPGQVVAEEHRTYQHP